MTRQLLRVPISKVHDDPDQPRKVYEKLAELAESLKAHGQQVPGIAYPHDVLRDQFILVDGHRRKQGLALAGIFEMELVVLSERPDPFDTFVLQTSLGVTGEKLSAYDLADACQRIEHLKPGLTRGEIAKLIGISAPKLSKCMTIAESLVPALRPLVESGELPFSVAACIARVPAENQVDLARKVVDGFLKRESVEDEVDKLLGKKVKPVIKSFKYRIGGLTFEYVGDKVEGLLADFAAMVEQVKRHAKPSDSIVALPVLLKRGA